MTTQFMIVEEFGRNSAKKLFLHDTETLTVEGRFASTLIEKWGMVAAKVDGEDSTGRSLLRDCSPAEVVDRACTIATDAIAEFRKRGWMITLPDVSELLRKTDG